MVRANLFHVDFEMGPILSDIFVDMGLFLSYIRFIAKFSEIYGFYSAGLRCSRSEGEWKKQILADYLLAETARTWGLQSLSYDCRLSAL